MKNYKLLLSAVVGGALMMFNLAALADDRPGVATLVRLVGHAEYSLDGGHVWIPAVVGKDFQPGTLIRTDDKCIADVLIGQSIPDKNIKLLQYNTRHDPANNIIPQVERNMVRLTPNTTLGVDKLVVPSNDPTVISDCELDLKKGHILASVKKVSPSSEYLVKIPNGVAAVRGTQFSLSTDGSGSDCEVVSGTVWISFTVTDSSGNPVLGPDGNPLPPIEVTLNPGQQFSLTAALLNQLDTTLMAAGANANLQTLITQLTNLATQTIGTLSQADFDTITEIIMSLNSPIITITIGVGPPNNGTPITVSSQ